MENTGMVTYHDAVNTFGRDEVTLVEGFGFGGYYGPLASSSLVWQSNNNEMVG
jgi:hypothetical protein